MTYYTRHQLSFDVLIYSQGISSCKAANDVESLTRSLESDAASTLSWFENNHMCANPDNSKQLCWV